MSTASRAAAHKPNSARSGFPAIGSRPVQFGIAVKKEPRYGGADEAEQHFVTMPCDTFEPARKTDLPSEFAEPQANRDDGP